MISTDIAANLLPWSLQAAVVVTLGSLLPWLFRLDVAGVRYAYWRAVAVLCLALPWIQPRHWRAPSAAGVVSVGDLMVKSIGAPIASAGRGLDWMMIALTVVAVGALVRLAWLTFGLVRLKNLRRAATARGVAGVERDVLPSIRTNVEIRYVPELGHPVTFGLLRPIVLLPERLSAQPLDIQRAVIGHEVLHVQRRDWAWLMLEEIAVCLFWFHPGSWWLASRIQLAREEVVDELAIQLTGRRKAYVEALLAFADATSVVPTAAFARRRHLFRRIALVSKEEVMSSRRIVATCAAMALIVGLGSWYAVSAFPLNAYQSITDQKMEPGPLELKAHAVTPENPIPRRTHFEALVLPDSIAPVRGSVGVRIILDDVGRIAEARPIEFALKGANYTVSMSGITALTGVGKVESGTPNLKEDLIGVLDAAVASVRQWRYDPPVEAPLSFTVQVRVGSGPEVMEFKSASENGALRVGGAIKPPIKIKDVRPVYPPLALEANVTGVVIIEVRIGTDGYVEEAHVLKSIPLLDQAALDAVKQWQFVPTLMNGQAMPLMMTVTINFAQ